MPRTPYRPARLRHAFFRGSDALRLKLLTPDQLRSTAWRRLFRDVYMDSSVPTTYEVRCRAVRLILPPGAVVTGPAAACLDGVEIGEPRDPVHVIAPPGTRWARSGCELKRTSWLPAEHIAPGEPPVTIPERTAWEIASGPDLVEAVAALDILFRADKPAKASMDPWIAAFPEAEAVRTIALSDPRAESPQESRTRVRLALAGFPKPIPQYELRANGRFIARLDLAWPEARVAVEYDGEWHEGTEAQIHQDRARLNRINNVGWRVVFITKVQLREPELFAIFAGQVRDALARSARA